MRAIRGTVVVVVGLLTAVAHAQNQVPNWEFDEDVQLTSQWNIWQGGNFDGLLRVEGAQMSGRYAMKIDIGDGPFDPLQVFRSYLELEQGETYYISFMAKADAPRTVTVQLQARSTHSWQVYWQEADLELTTEPQVFEFEYTHTGPTVGGTGIFNDDIDLHWLLVGDGTDLYLDRVWMGNEPPPPFDPTRLARAQQPNPNQGDTDVAINTDLTWVPGRYAQTHNVYFGTTFEDVNDADGPDSPNVQVSMGQTTTSFDPEGALAFGRTYYWRVDEVNAPPDATVFKGDVWSFEVEPYAYPIADVNATASSSDKVNNGPENTVNGSGLDGDAHSTESEDMWVSSMAGPQPTWIQYEFDDIYTLDRMLVWNYNGENEQILGYGFKDVTIEYSLDGEQWTPLGDYEFSQAPADPTYEPNRIDMNNVMARFVRLTANSNWSTFGIPMYGLSEVRFHYVPVKARLPQPEAGGQDVPVDVVLTWRPGRKAASHDVYLSGNEQEVLDGTALVDATTDASYAPLPLDYGQQYYWRVDEVNEVEVPGLWQGDLWSFTTTGFKVVDDFESYTAEVGEEIFTAWADGFDDDGNGSLVGHDISSNDTFGETTIVHNGSQSMPLFYDNSTATVSEATYTLAGEDWTASGIKSLSLYFYGDPENTGQLYAKINGTTVSYDGDPADITRAQWQPWNIDLSTVSTNLSNVRSLTIGVEGAGASGVLYIDDVRLYPQEPEYVTPAAPTDANLAAYYALDGNLDDGSGNGFVGTANGDPTYAAGMEGQAIQLDGVDDYVVVDSVGITGAAPRTISGWARADTTSINAWTDVFGFTGPSGNGGHFDIEAVGDTGNTTLGYYGVHRYGWERDIIPIDLEWHHLAATYDGGTVSWYGDGLLVGSADVDPADFNPPGPVHIGKREDNSNFFPGLVDEVRIYDLALSEAEIAWLAGKRTPLAKPF